MLGGLARPGLAVAVVTCLLVSSLGVVTGLAVDLEPRTNATHAVAAPPIPSSTRSTTTTTGSRAGVSRALAIEDALRAKGISPARVHLPNFPGAVTNPAQPVQPFYTQAPAPLGVADIGLKNVSGVLTPYALNSTSVAGTVDITNLQSFYLDGGGPTIYGVQLNSVVNGVTIFGQSSYEFWSQNYVDYSPSNQQLVFGDEVWNFSSTSVLFPQNSIYNFSANGTFADFPYLYQGIGPTITIGYPFSLTLYLNTSTLGDRPALWFNYTVSNATFRQSESFDYLVFNSTVGRPTAPAPVPYYQADGYNYDPAGFANDMEFALLGNGGGDIAAFTVADATMSLQFWNATAHAMEEVPSAFNSGQDTGETAVGLSVTSSGTASPYALVQAGPGFVHGLWNYSAGSGSTAVTVDLHPRNAFIFVNVGGTENVSGAQWVPSALGNTVLYVPTGGTYFFEFLLADRDPQGVAETVAVPITILITLAVDASQGVYTPLFAMANTQLAAISASGTGTAADPYHLIQNQYGSIAPQFAQLDIWLFPLFPGILLAGTTDSVVVTPPSFQISIPSWEVNPNYTPLGLPLSNNLQIEFYDASNISLVQAAGITGWLSNAQFGFPVSEVMLWGCTNVLVASDTFEDEGNALLLYGGTNNTVWGNTILSTSVGVTPASSLDAGNYITGVNETESGDLIYNNYFAVALPAITPIYDPVPCGQYGICVPTAYLDTWNVSEQPATNVAIVNGFNLTGSIIGTWYQGGNYWSNYGTPPNLYGVLPYNDSAAITVGGDFVPLVPFAVYPVTFEESGLIAGLSWGVGLDGSTLSTNASSLVLDYPNGTFELSVTSPFAYTVTDTLAEFSVAGSAVTVHVHFSATVFLNVEETGLPRGFEWSASINGTGTRNTTITESNESGVYSFCSFWVVTGTYNVSVAAFGYVSNRSVVPVTVAAVGHYPFESAFVYFAFAPVPGTLNLLVTPTTAYTYVDGGLVSLVGGRYNVSLAPGAYSVVVVAVGYYTYYNNVTVTSNQTTALAVVLTAIPSTSPSSSPSGINTLGWELIALFAALAVAFLIGMVYFARRGRSGGGPPMAPPPQPWQETPPNGPPPLG